MKIDIICVGKLKEKYLREACAEYEKRLSGYCRLAVFEVSDEKTTEGASQGLVRQILEAEAVRLQKYLSDTAFIITLEIEGEQKSSVELADQIEKLKVGGVSHIQFVIGGSLGLSDSIIKRSRLHLSFSRLTFPHQLARVILLEQLYRVFRINAGEPYHK